VAAGMTKAHAILPPAVFDNADLYGKIGQSDIWIIKYFLHVHPPLFNRYFLGLAL